MFPRPQVPMCDSHLLRPRLRDITLLPHTVTDVTLSRMAVALAAILVPYFGSRFVEFEKQYYEWVHLFIFDYEVCYNAAD